MSDVIYKSIMTCRIEDWIETQELISTLGLRIQLHSLLALGTFLEFLGTVLIFYEDSKSHNDPVFYDTECPNSKIIS